MKKNSLLRLLAFALVMLSLTPLLAQETDSIADAHLIQYDRVLVALHDGRSYEIGIDGSSSLRSYEEEAGHFVLVVNGTGAYYYTFDREEVKTIKFLESEDQSYIEDLHEVYDDHSCKIVMGKEGVQFHPSTQGKVCHVRALSGRIIRRFVIQPPYVMSCDDMPRGIYLITVDNYTLKIMLR